MKYFYLTAEGVTAGPESLETLCTMMSSGPVSLATLVVPAGGEDWTPLARVLRYFYQDTAGATAGPVAFSELNRLCQIHAIPAGAWVVEESGTDWKTAAAVLGAGGVALPAAAPAAPRVVHAASRPQIATTGNPYAAPHAAAGHRVVVRRRASGGIGRPQYFVILALLLVLSIFGPAAYLHYKLKVGVTTWDELDSAILQYRILAVVCMLTALLAVTVLAVFRIQNIGWNRFLTLILLAPGITAITAVQFRLENGGVIAAIGIRALAALGFQCALLALPAGFARHRRLDAAAWIIFALELLVVAGFFTLAKIEEDRRKEREKNTVPAPAAVFLHPIL